MLIGNNAVPMSLSARVFPEGSQREIGRLKIELLVFAVYRDHRPMWLFLLSLE